MTKEKSKNDLIVIIGGGPAGFGAALAFNNNNYENVVVLEGRPDMNFDVRNSYPVGINVRGQNSIKSLFGSVDKHPDFEKFGLRVDQWKICVGPSINVANFDSGLVYGTSRSDVTVLLYEEVQRRGNEKIKVLFGHKAKHVDLKSRTLLCETENGQEVTFNPKCLIIADGYKSRVRDILAESDKSLKVQKWPWTLSFRVLCSDYYPKTDLNPYIHYIQNQIYTSRFLDGRWTTVVAMKEDSPEFLRSDNPSDENVAELKAHLKKLAPQTI
jgi:2-polyprenyl-6-methoxyphenol hydroxylase-like FAD-dependent oxidoreductase